MNQYARGAEVISLFCRTNMNTKRELPIRASEMGLLIFLVKREAPPTPLEVAHFFQISKPMVTAMIRALENKGFLLKIPSQIDGRSFALSPTQKAKLIVEETYEEYHKNIELLHREMGDGEFEALIGLLDKANAILKENRKQNA